MTWLVLAAVVVAFVVAYGSWTARRLDRLHARLDAASAALDAQLRVRAEAAARFAETAPLPRDTIASLAMAAAVAAEATRLDHPREVVENALSRALREVRPADAGSPEAAALVDATTRASFARRFRNDAVRDVLVVRRRWVVRLLHLAGSAPRPDYFEIDDAPVALAEPHRAGAPYD